jgi:hypothetical protein
MNNRERYAFVKSAGPTWWSGDPKDIAEDDAITASNVRQAYPGQKVPMTNAQKLRLSRLSDDYREAAPTGSFRQNAKSPGTFVQRWSPEGSRKGQVPLYQNLDGSVTYPGSPTFNRRKLALPRNNLRNYLASKGLVSGNEKLDVKRLPLGREYWQNTTRELAPLDGRGFFTTGQKDLGLKRRARNFFGSLLGGPGASIGGGFNQMLGSAPGIGDISNPTVFVDSRGQLQFTTPGDSAKRGLLNVGLGALDAIPIGRSGKALVNSGFKSMRRPFDKVDGASFLASVEESAIPMVMDSGHSGGSKALGLKDQMLGVADKPMMSNPANMGWYGSGEIQANPNAIIQPFANDFRDQKYINSIEDGTGTQNLFPNIHTEGGKRYQFLANSPTINTTGPFIEQAGLERRSQPDPKYIWKQIDDARNKLTSK